jgi:hypothetical protein
LCCASESVLPLAICCRVCRGADAATILKDRVTHHTAAAGRALADSESADARDQYSKSPLRWLGVVGPFVQFAACMAEVPAGPHSTEVAAVAGLLAFPWQG